ncbi:hypothetical protein C823_000112 [Eubacterium plexicaudatum ASF492]|nr:hypothetical protein C823_000112 [Eubacterium plexicaudatum ASF492]
MYKVISGTKKKREEEHNRQMEWYRNQKRGNELGGILDRISDMFHFLRFLDFLYLCL